MNSYWTAIWQITMNNTNFPALYINNSGNGSQNLQWSSILRIDIKYFGNLHIKHTDYIFNILCLTLQCI